jgi:hypothetical protein
MMSLKKVSISPPPKRKYDCLIAPRHTRPFSFHFPAKQTEMQDKYCRLRVLTVILAAKQGNRDRDPHDKK